LTGQYQVRPQRERRPAPWWQALAGMAASWVLFWTLTLYLDVQRLQQQSGEVRQQTISLYQQLFPGERVRALERQIREKLSGDSGGSDAGFLSATQDRKSTRLNSSHVKISYAVFCLKKKKK